MSSSLKVIDWERQGNVVRFTSGRRELERWWGDDWNDAPYEHNAGTVYPEFAHGYREVAFGFDVRLAEPCDGHLNSPWCKDDMRDRRVPSSWWSEVTPGLTTWTCCAAFLAQP